MIQTSYTVFLKAEYDSKSNQIWSLYHGFLVEFKVNSLLQSNVIILYLHMLDVMAGCKTYVFSDESCATRLI